MEMQILARENQYKAIQTILRGAEANEQLLDIDSVLDIKRDQCIRMAENYLMDGQSIFGVIIDDVNYLVQKKIYDLSNLMFCMYLIDNKLATFTEVVELLTDALIDESE